ncbi:PAS-associated [Metarhizium album ARSEF 1941]|uniref:PAS-associated n=1 Tax=Metarhizium album (strain ARSEF 1941) TaxID=1081103 RepID=A0A0B2X4S6_METAS|nr:PAS-associated [Metarhizium album ARSEF 1941]KHO00281.1 PAS-associated [Metarhizium album ARSEF 1941]
MSSVVDMTSTSDAVPPLSPASSSDLSLEESEPELPAKPLPVPPTSGSPIKFVNGDPGLPPLQLAGGYPDGLDPIAEEELDPGSFDLVMPVEQIGSTTGKYKLEKRSELLFSSRHLEAIFDDSAELHCFSQFLYKYRPASVPLLTYFLEALKALRAIEYSNAVLRKLGPLTDFEFTHEYFQAHPTTNQELKAKANAAFDIMAREDLPMYITNVWIETVSVSIRHRVMGMPSHSSEGLAEVFCLTDPSRHDNPIVFMSEEFNRTTQYGVDYVVGRNCRFLQGPYTNPFSVARIREKVEKGIEHYETFLNYRRDGSPFMNLVMIAPLYDSRGAIRYFIGAQVDISGLAMGCHDLAALKRVADEDEKREAGEKVPSPSKDEFTQLAEILGTRELEIVRDRGGDMLRLPLQSSMGLHHDEKIALTKPNADGLRDSTKHGRNSSKNRVILGTSPEPQNTLPPLGDTMRPFSSLTAAALAARHNGRLTGVYEHYLLARPYPSLRILFTSPSMRVPGILQSPLLDRIGGSTRMRDQLIQALANGQGVTAKVKWLTVNHRRHANRPTRKRNLGDHPLEAHLRIDDNDDDANEDMGRSRWLHCTPLTGANGRVGVWMIVIIDEEPDPSSQPPHNVVTPERARPDGAVSDRSVSGLTPQRPSNGGTSLAATKLRPRRSSDTLGGNPATASARNEDKSVTKSIHQQHSLNTHRSPKPTLQTLGVAARFYSPEALSLATQAGSSTQQRRESSRNSRPRHEDESSDTEQIWPLPPSGSAGAKRNRETGIRVPSVIRETSSERAVVWGNRSDGDAASITSLSSAYTVRIEEE